MLLGNEAYVLQKRLKHGSFPTCVTAEDFSTIMVLILGSLAPAFCFLLHELLSVPQCSPRELAYVPVGQALQLDAPAERPSDYPPPSRDGVVRFARSSFHF
jgi:hypothetical protein